MNIVFTDIDGVLNPHWRTKWSKSAIALYNQLCKEYNLRPVITSTWRTNHTKEQLQEIFTSQGIDVEIYDYTPQLEQRERGLEIKQWLDSNPCDTYVVLDDKTSEIEGYVNNVVKCRSWIGLTQDEYNEVVNILTNENN